MSNVQVQLGGNTVHVDVQSSGVSRAAQSVREAVAAQTAAQAAKVAAETAETNAEAAQAVAEAAAGLIFRQDGPWALTDTPTTDGAWG